MTLTIDDYEKIAKDIYEGDGCIEYDKDNELLTFDYHYGIDGYREDDTNAFVETDRWFYIENVHCTDEDDKEVAEDLDEEVLNNMVA